MAVANRTTMDRTCDSSTEKAMILRVCVSLPTVHVTSHASHTLHYAHTFHTCAHTYTHTSCNKGYRIAFHTHTHTHSHSQLPTSCPCGSAGITHAL